MIEPLETDELIPVLPHLRPDGTPWPKYDEATLDRMADNGGVWEEVDPRELRGAPRMMRCPGGPLFWGHRERCRGCSCNSIPGHQMSESCTREFKVGHKYADCPSCVPDAEAQRRQPVRSTGVHGTLEHEARETLSLFLKNITDEDYLFALPHPENRHVITAFEIAAIRELVEE